MYMIFIMDVLSVTINVREWTSEAQPISGFGDDYIPC
jgi:hypothetical protein